jgi:hypothetical protein
LVVRKKVDYSDLEFISDINLVRFYGDEFLAIYHGESGCELLSNGVRALAKRQGLFTRHYYPSYLQLTDKAIDIMNRLGLISKVR